MSLSKKARLAFKKGVLSNKRYTLKPIECPIKLNQNESPFDLPKNLKRRILHKLKRTQWNIYPDFTPEGIYEKTARALGVKSSEILIGNGSNEMIFTLLAATLEKGKKAVISEPTFTVYKLISTNMNASVVSVPLKKDLTYDTDAIIKSSRAGGSVTVICSPNNPTGTYMPGEDIKKVLRASGGMVVVDEAYIQFGGETVIELINDFPNLVVLRTFSKAFGLAGLRMGMMISNPDNIAECAKVKLPYNMNIFTLAALDCIADNMDYVKKHVDNIIEQREILGNELKKFGDIKVIPSSTNFFLIKAQDSAKLYKELLRYGILVRDVSGYPMLKDHLRISVGNRKQNAKLIGALKKICDI